MSKRTLTMIVALVAALLIGTTTTLAYLTDTDGAVNVMTIGNVDIEQNEEQRVEGTTQLEEFEQFKPFLPAVHDTNDDNKIAWAPESEWPIPEDYTGDHPEAYKVFNNNITNVQDKFVSVENTGKNDAYVRTIIAYEWPEGLDDLVHISINDIPGVVAAEEVGFVELDGVRYMVYSFVYDEALAPGEETIPSLKQIFLNKATTSEDVALFGENFEVLALSQAVQADGFDSAEEALNEGFYAVGANATEEEVAQLQEDLETLLTEEYPWDGEVDMPTTNWAVEGNPDTSWYDASATEYTIDTAEELAGLAQLVNEGTTFKGKTVKLAADVDLGAHQWTPIGNSTNKFQGTFDGGSNTISNLKIDTPSTSNVGLFGFTTGGMIKNVVVENAAIAGRLNVGVVAGTPHTSKYDNITVTGNVKVDGMSYVGGVMGKNCYANVSDITVDVSDASYVSANSVEDGTAYRTYVGGVIGFMGEGGHTVSNVTSNIDVIGTTCDVGGITGIAHYGNSFVNCSSSGDVTITDAAEAADAEEIGGIAGVWNNNGAPVTFDGCSYTGTLTTNITEGVDLDDNTITGKAYSATGTGTLVIK